MPQNIPKKSKKIQPSPKNDVTESRPDECIQEFKAFARGGLYSINLLNRVWPNILKEYSVHERQLDKLLHEAGLYIRMGKIKSSRCSEDPESP